MYFVRFISLNEVSGVSVQCSGGIRCFVFLKPETFSISHIPHLISHITMSLLSGHTYPIPITQLQVLKPDTRTLKPFLYLTSHITILPLILSLSFSLFQVSVNQLNDA